MSREAKRDGADARLLLRFMQDSSNTDIIEQIYAHTLTVVEKLFTPDRAFVALSESGGGTAPSAVQAGWLLDLSIPIYAGARLMGRVMLQYDQPHGFSEQD